MQSVSHLYGIVGELLGLGALAWNTDTLRLALLDSGYTFDAAHTGFADVTAAEISGTGYIQGGFALTGTAVLRYASVTALDADDLTLSGMSGVFRSGVVYLDATRNGIDRPLLKYLLFDNTPGDVTLAGDPFPIAWGASGLVRLAIG